MAIKNRSIQKVLLSIFIIVTLLNTLNIESAQAASAVSSHAKISSRINCRNPKIAAERTYCKRIESQILAATVRIELHTWATFGGHKKEITTKSHATILDGKYLVTHNHYKYSLTKQVKLYGEVKGYTAISLRRASGKLLLDEASLKSFSIVYQDAETLVLAFLKKNGWGLFEAEKLPSAKFADHNDIRLRAGDELAQIDWNGKIAHIDWVRVDNISLNDAVHQLQVNNFPKKGCSGGGVFLKGVHIGNNWAKNIEKDPDTNEITRRYSIIALNTSELVELDQ